MQRKGTANLKRFLSLALALALTGSLFLGELPGTRVLAADTTGAIANDSLSVKIGDLGQIEKLNIKNNPLNRYNEEINFVLPNDTSPQNGTQHQWMGEMIFSTRTSDDGNFPADNTGFTEADTNRTLAAGGSTTYSDASAKLAGNPYITKTVGDKSVEVDFKGQDLTSTASRTMKGFDVKSVFNTDTADGSLLWSITLTNKSGKYIEFGDVGLPMPWNNKYTSQDSVYNERVTAHTFAGADSGYAYAVRCSGEGDYMLFTPVASSGARIEYVDNWVGSNNGVTDNRAGSLFSNWTGDSGGWQPGLSVYYVHSKDIRKTGRGYFTDASSLVLAPSQSKTYQFRFSAVRAGDNTPQESAASANNASASIEQREKNMRSILYKEGMIDAVAVPGFQTAINMDTRLDLHYDDSLIKDVNVQISCVHENDPFDEAHIPTRGDGLVNNSRTGLGAHSETGKSCQLVGTRTVDGEQHHIYSLKFGCIGNNSVRVSYKLKVGDTYVDKFTECEFNVLAKLSDTVNTHAKFMTDSTQDNDSASATYGIFSDWYLSSGKDSSQRSHWGDDWSHDNINSITMKNYLNPDKEQIEAIEKYLIDFMWERYMKNTHDSFTVANYLSASGVYSTSGSPYTRTFSEMMEATGFFNMYRIEKTYPDLMRYREPPEYYLEKAYGIYYNRVDSGDVGYYGEQQVPQMIEALRAEGMTNEAGKLQTKFAKDKGTSVTNATYPYGSEFAYDNTGEEGAYAAAKALRTYYPSDTRAAAALTSMGMANRKTRAMRGIQPTWYHYADPVFIGGESWWNFQYTASLAGYIMDDYLRYESDGAADASAWAERMSYAAKLSNFNAVNMGQISASSVGSASWRYTMYKGGYGAMNVNDGGSRVMNNGWNDFSGESDEGLYGSMLSISADVVTDPVFGLFGYGCSADKTGGVYTVVPLDGFGKRLNVIDEKIYAELAQDSCTKAEIAADGSSLKLTLACGEKTAHLSSVALSGAGLKDGYYKITVNGAEAGQCRVAGKAGTAAAMIPAGETAVLELTAMSGGENAAPSVSARAEADTLQAVVPFRLRSEAYDDGAPGGALTYAWAVTAKPDGAEMTIGTPARPNTTAVGTKAGSYTVTLTVGDGEKTTAFPLTLTLGEAPERTAPVIGSASGTQDSANPTVADLHAEATLDPLYHGTAAYAWSVVSQPDGGGAVIGNAGRQDAMLKVAKAGSYVVRVVVTDADKSSEQQITVVMDDRADGVQRGGGVVTQTGAAPALPAELSVILADGTVAASAVTWDAVPAESYASAGSFEVGGTVAGTALRVACTVYAVSGGKKNVAPFAAATAIINSTDDLGGVAGLNDGHEPSASNDTSNGAWHNWRGAQGDPAWVAYTWDAPVVIDSADAYYFRDSGGNFQPKTVYYEYKDSAGRWKALPGAAGMGTALNKYNTTTFSPVSTTAIRMTMTPLALGCGVLEWKVYGYGSFLDRTALKAAIAQAKAIDASLFADGTAATIQAALAEAQAVLDNAGAAQDAIDAAAAKLRKVLSELKAADGNLAYTAAVTTSFVSSWESLAAVNDGKTPSGSSYNPAKPRYGTWGNTSASETITYTWPAKVSLSSADVYFWYDGDEGKYTSGGILVPKTYVYEYLADDGSWQPVANASGCGTAMDGFNKTTFDAVSTTSVRLVMTKQANDENGVGVCEWKVFGGSAAGGAAGAAAGLIGAIGAVSLGSRSKIEAARAAYDALTDEQKKEVGNYLTLLEAEAAYQKLAAAQPGTGGSSSGGSRDALGSAKEAAGKKLTDYAKTRAADAFGPRAAAIEKARAAGQAAVGRAQDEAAAESAMTAALKAVDAAAAKKGRRFEDVPDPAWFREAVDFAVDNGFFNGVSGTRFRPDGGMTRGMLATVLYRLDGEPASVGVNPFADVPDTWYTDAVTWGSAKKLVEGVGGGRFDPDAGVTREQLAATLYRYASYRGKSLAAKADLSGFADAGRVAPWAKDAVAWANAAGLMNGRARGGRLYLDPAGKATRAEVAAMLMRFARNVLK